MRLRMRSSSSNLRAAAAVLLALTAPSAFAQQVSGKVTADGSQPITGAIVKVQAKGGVQTVVSNTADDGSFSFTGIKTDQALLSVEKNGQLLFRSIVSTKTGVPLTINLQKPFQLADWHPADMTADPAQGVLVVDRTGGVSRIRGDTQGPHQDVLFRIPSSYAVSSLAADGGIVVVTTNSAIGCTLFRFTVASGTTDQKVLSPGNTCSGIALLGASMNVVFSKQREVRHWDDWNSSGRVLAGLGSGAALGGIDLRPAGIASVSRGYGGACLCRSAGGREDRPVDFGCGLDRISRRRSESHSDGVGKEDSHDLARR